MESKALLEEETRRQGVTTGVIAPHDARYDDARKAFNLAVDQHPALIVPAQNAADVAAAIQLARSRGLGVAVQSTGHGVVRPADGALLVLTSGLTGVRVDPETQTARVAAGEKWGAVLEKAQAYGLAPLLGSSPTVGAIGYTLGGGLGWLARKYGIAIDSVLSFEVVTAGAQVLRASRTENSDLFWALRGGGGGFGVITEMEIRLYPVDMVYGGSLFYPAEMAREVYARYREWIQTVPDEMTSSLALMNFPPFPQVPEPLRGKSFLILRGCYSGPVEEGKALFDDWRSWSHPAVDLFQEMPFSRVAEISNDPKEPGAGKSSTVFLKDLSDPVIETLLQFVHPEGGRPRFVLIDIRHIGGAVSRGDPQESAFAHRSPELLLQTMNPVPTPEAYRAAEESIEAFKVAIAPHTLPGLFMNFLSGAEAVKRTPQAYLPETLARLKAVKAKYDPDNLFRFSYDIPPAA